MQGKRSKRRRGEEEEGPSKRTQSEAAAAKRAPALLSWMRNAEPIDPARDASVEEVESLGGRLQAALRAGGVERLFPVQLAVWEALAGGFSDAHDVCLHAPTGSGKTLAYALPLVCALRGRVIRRLRALVVLPTHDLAQQVGLVLRPLCEALGLAVAVVSGKGALRPEAEALVERVGSQEGAQPEFASRVDVLVATPGRLVAHVQSTEGFTLSHLRLLVVDEVDRLLRQSYQDWLPIVLEATAPTPRDAPPWGSPCTSHAQPVGLLGHRRFRGGMQGDRVATPRLAKIVVSATMTRDPSKIGQLQLHSPLLLTVGASDQRYQLPPQLEQWRVVVPADKKPFALIALLQSMRGVPTIVFTASVEATHKLFLALSSLDADASVGTCVEYSSLHSHGARTKALHAFRAREATVLVASDAATRGLDVEGIEVVISYDTPVYLKTYVHRVGRTARAGRPGRAYTLLRPEEVRHFKLMLKKAATNVVAVHKIPAVLLAELDTRCAAACAALVEPPFA